MLGQIVTHTRFGRGRVTAFDPPRMAITFNDGTVKVFAYPQAVEKFIRFEDAEAQSRALRDREMAETSEQARVMAVLAEHRRQAEEDNRRRMEAIHEKKVAAARRTAARSAMARKAKAEEK